MTSVHDIPVARTPPGGYGERNTDRYAREMPDPILAGCTDRLVDGAPDLRGTWGAVDVRSNGAPMPPHEPIWGHVERIEQAGSRVVVTGGGVVHDFLSCDGTDENGVHDVMASDYSTPVVVAASFEDGVLVLRPSGMPGIEVRRWREGDQMVWEYSTLFTVRLERVDDEGTVSGSR